MSYVEIPGARLWYQLQGEGEVIAQIHGAGFGHDNFAKVTPHLAKRFRILDYDMRGYGLSDRPKQQYSMEVWARDLNALLEALQIPKAHIHGTSMGGMIAQKFAVLHPDKVKSLTVGCTSCKADQTMKRMFGGWKYMAEKEGMGSMLLAETLGIQALSREFLDSSEGPTTLHMIREVM
ncbi:MAG: alpha/beta fold hydrolase, partial [Candidatus Bathyarchaeia archaeon]